MKDKDLKKLEKVEERLYAKSFEEDPIDINQFEEKDYELRGKWGQSDEHIDMKKSKKLSLVKKILVGSVLFFIFAFGFAVFKFSNGANVVSMDDIDVILSGPVSVGGGEQFSFYIDVINNSSVMVESAKLFIEYPEGSYSDFESQEELSTKKIDLGVIQPLQDIDNTFLLVFFGEENTEKEINVTLELRFQDSSATLEKTETYSIRIESSPVNLSLSIPKETNLGHEFDIVIDLESNSNNTISGLMAKIDYPFGFVFKSSVPSPSADDNIWDIGDLASANRRDIKIRGVLDGQEGDEKVFSVAIGTKNKDDTNIIGTIYNSISESTDISKPFIGINLLVNGSDAREHISKSEETVRIDVLWESNIDTRIVDGRIEIKLDGDILNKFSVSVGAGGFYRSIDNTIIWDKTRNKNLSIIEPSESGSVSFSLRSLPLINSLGKVFLDPKITIKAIASGKRISDLNVPEEAVTFIDKIIKIESGLSLSSRIVYYSGPFTNSGPMPPKAEKETTYTIIWNVTNSSNKISSATVNMVLPPYVRWIGVLPDSKEMVSFNKAGGEIIWNIGDVESGAGVEVGSRELVFQIGFLPSISHVGTTPQLTGEATIFGEDTFTNTIIKNTTRSLSTRITTDSKFNSTQAQVSF